jgi:hypothetical protein
MYGARDSAGKKNASGSVISGRAAAGRFTIRIGPRNEQ